MLLLPNYRVSQKRGLGKRPIPPMDSCHFLLRLGGLAKARAELLLIFAREVADVGACVFHEWFFPAEKGVVQAVVRADKLCDGFSEEMKQGAQSGGNPDFRARGAPHLRVFMALVVYCPAKGSQGDKSVADAVSDLLDRLNSQISNLSLQHLGRIVKRGRVKVQEKKMAELCVVCFESSQEVVKLPCDCKVAYCAQCWDRCLEGLGRTEQKHAVSPGHEPTAPVASARPAPAPPPLPARLRSVARAPGLGGVGEAGSASGHGIDHAQLIAAASRVGRRDASRQQVFVIMTRGSEHRPLGGGERWRQACSEAPAGPGSAVVAMPPRQASEIDGAQACPQRWRGWDPATAAPASRVPPAEAAPAAEAPQGALGDVDGAAGDATAAAALQGSIIRRRRCRRRGGGGGAAASALPSAAGAAARDGRAPLRAGAGDLSGSRCSRRVAAGGFAQQRCAVVW
ncbi:unnamed protein product [Prorocentrum cordatum]|uniref:Uncharacterized protein n=1 Tax=Prorocentrum cordatum TaxID=2364126 RepID=A0ABN9UDY9_9DINO|nr:unnamed protein product [Polarella glacialis]